MLNACGVELNVNDRAIYSYSLQCTDCYVMTFKLT